MNWREKIRNTPDGTYLQYGNTPLPIKPDTGYWVGAGAYSLDDIELDLEYGERVVYGLWTDQETNTQYIDRVAYLEDLDQAIELGRQNQEIAIWDIANNKEIRL